MNAKPISEKTPMSCGVRLAVGMGGLAAVAGGFAGIWFLLLQPLLNVVAARSWTEVDCQIVSSSIERHADSDGDTYSPEILFRYRFGNHTYTSQRHSFYNWSGSHASARRVVDRFPTGGSATCFVDPDDPASATLNRSFSIWSGLAILFGLLILFGVVLVGAALKPASDKAPGVRGVSPTLHANASEMSGDPDGLFSQWEGPQKLEPESTRLWRVIGIFALGVFWNGIVGVFLAVLFTGGGGVCMGLFLIPFVVVGLLLIGGFFHQLLSLFNPTVEIALSSGAVPVGGEVDVAWQMTGNVRRIRNLNITIEGTESATYTRGTSTYTDTETFETLLVVETSDPSSMQFGSETVRIPKSTMHSFDATNNTITWTVNLQGEIPRWPDVKESYEFKVKPVSS